MTDVENLDRIGKAMQAAWQRVKKAQSRMWGEWMTIGEGLLEGRRWAMHQAGVNKPEGRGFVVAYSEWLKRYKVDDMDKSDRAKLLQLMEERPAVEQWRSTLTDHERRNLNNPVIVWRKWTAATRVKKPKPRTAGASASEMGRARHTVQEQDERIRELEEELAFTRERLASYPLAPDDSDVDKAKARLSLGLTLLLELAAERSARVAVADIPEEYDAIDLAEIVKWLNDLLSETKAAQRSGKRKGRAVAPQEA